MKDEEENANGPSADWASVQYVPHGRRWDERPERLRAINELDSGVEALENGSRLRSYGAGQLAMLA